MSKKIEKVSGTVETTVCAEFDTAGGVFISGYVDKIKNPTMKKAAQSYVKAVQSGQKSAWEVAKACSRMKLDARKEFGSDERLADFLGLKNKGQFNKLRRTGEIAGLLESTGVTQSNAQELLPLIPPKDVRETHKYSMTLEEFIEEEEERIASYTQLELREKVKKLKIETEDQPGDKDEKEETEESEGKESGHESGESETNGDEIVFVDFIEVNREEVKALSSKEYENFVKELHEIFKKYSVEEWVKNPR